MDTRMTRSRFRCGIAAAFTAAVLFTSTACAGGSEPEEANATNGASSNAKLALAVTAAPASLDPAQLQEGQQSYVWGSVFDTLLYVDNDGKLQPNAAESWKFSDDGLSLSLTLREGMTFSNGDTVTAKEVAGTLERTRTTPGQQQGKLAAVASIEAPNNRTVVLKLKQPEPALLTNLALAAGVIGDPDTLNEKTSALDPTASGPYTLDKGATVAGTTYVLNRRDDYWNAKAYPFKTVTVRVIQDRTAVFNALQAGELDAGNVDPAQVKQIEGAGFKTTKVEAQAVANLVLADRAGTLLKPLADERVRKAINMAFDREKMVQQVLRGSGKATVQIFNPKGAAYDAALEGSYKFDPAAAKKLMADAGYADGFDVTMPATVISKSFEPLITQALGDIGIRVTWEPVPPQNAAAAVSSKKYPMVFFLDGLNVTQRELQNNFSDAGFLNPFGSKYPELTELITQVSLERDEAKATELYKKINAFVVENALDAPLFYVGTIWATKDGIEYLGDGSNTLSTIRAFNATK
ncbi:ABC transporter substrate-binding protein [Arthrobacter rhizosphaerae]|uniref:ABC transporter substrate-binding protein n=1 Tax=Arthrobacter rhizosphaerae TaxID=2855490 RepID=UPI001FF30BEA|nr:ABC transporter substrate-binding protein [Arthrobacter rhizosphaerae]